MVETLIIVLIILVIICIAIQIFLVSIVAKSNNKKELLLLGKQLELYEKNQGKVDTVIRDEMYRNREETGIVIERMRQTIEQKLTFLQEDNNRKLEQMRATVDEKLNATLEKRLNQSFKLVGERLDMVSKGLGEMQHLASGVGDLKKILTNIKTRGIWGEVQLGSLLEQILTLDQYDVNVPTKKGSSERVEFALRLPKKDYSDSGIIYLPIDAKFPVEDYQRLVDAQDKGDVSLVQEMSKQLEIRIRACAKDINEKYIAPPDTTDFGIMFLPVEGLYAEVLRIPGLCENLQADYHIVITGPTTLAALLNSLQVGFRTLAIEKHSSQVWELLGAVKTEFSKFGDILDKTQKKLQEASNTIESAAKKSRTIERKLKNVHQISQRDMQYVAEDESKSQISVFDDEDI